jgi:uncharacterized RDD family membrane protein YckC
MQWFYAENGQQKGPLEEAALDQLVAAGLVRDDTLVWREGMTEWQAHSAVRGARPAAPPLAAPVVGSDAGEIRYCAECGRPYPASQLVAIGPAAICGTCKPVYLQRLREGGAKPVGAMRYAGFWVRFAARLIDGILLNVAFLIVRIPLGLGSLGNLNRNPAAAAAIIGASVFVALLSVVAAACYEIFFVSTRGATPGKMIFGLKIVRSDGSPLPISASTGRYFAQWLSGITLMIGYIIAGFDDQKRALHDRICDTRVIHTR